MFRRLFLAIFFLGIIVMAAEAASFQSLFAPDADLWERWTAHELETMLNDAARDFINSPRGAYIADGALIVSRIYDWFHEDFGEGEEAVLAHLRHYADQDLAEALAAADGIDSYVYDWALNDAN